MSKLFKVVCKSKEEFDAVTGWGIQNGYTPYGSSGKCFPSEPCISLYRDKHMISGYIVNEEITFKEFKNKYMNKQTFEVEEQFILDAHKAADDEWREKIEKKFPELFGGIFKFAKTGDKFKHKDGDTYIFTKISDLYVLINIADGSIYNSPQKNPRDVAYVNNHMFTKI